MSERGFVRTEDYTEENAPRVFGRETETNSDIFKTHAVVNRFGVGRNYTTQQPGMLRLVDFVPQKYRVSYGERPHTSAFVSTGGQVYIDGSAEHPVFESATAECEDPTELREHTHANLRIMIETMNNVATELKLPKPEVFIRSGYDNVVAPDGTVPIKKSSLGSHENYATRTPLTNTLRSKPDTRSSFPAKLKTTNGLWSFLALRKLIDGAGMVADGHFSLSQKPDAFDFTGKSIDAKTHGTKLPAMFFHDRYELRTGENNKSDFVIEHVTALTSLILRYMDHGDFPEDLILADPAHALLDISRDPHAMVWLMNGQQRRAMDVLNEMAYRAREDAEMYGELPEFEADAVEVQQSITKDLEQVNFANNYVGKVGEYLDWAGRLNMFYQLGLKHEQIKIDPRLRLVMKDLRWDRANENDNDEARQYFRQFGHAARQLFLPDAPNTRAKWRKQVAGELFKKGILGKATWGEVTSSSAAVPDQKVDSPFRTKPLSDFGGDAQQRTLNIGSITLY